MMTMTVVIGMGMVGMGTGAGGDEGIEIYIIDMSYDRVFFLSFQLSFCCFAFGSMTDVMRAIMMNDNACSFILLDTADVK